MENGGKTVNTKKILRIVIPVLVIVVVGVMWFAKNSGGAADAGAADGANPDFVLEVTEGLDIEALKSYGLPIIIDFGADSCIPCKEMAPVLQELNQDLRGEAIVKFVDVWKYPELAEGYPVRVIPTQILIDAEGNPYVPADPQASQMTMYGNQETQEHLFTAHEGGMTKEMILTALTEMGLEQ